MTTCGHTCCGIRGNPYHAHTHEPDRCSHCAAAQGDRPVHTAAIVADVIRRVVPEIPGLPEGPELVEHVSAAVTAVCAQARTDPDLAGLDPAELHTAISGRVGLILAFCSSKVDQHG